MLKWPISLLLSFTDASIDAKNNIQQYLKWFITVYSYNINISW